MPMYEDRPPLPAGMGAITGNHQWSCPAHGLWAETDGARRPILSLVLETRERPTRSNNQTGVVPNLRGGLGRVANSEEDGPARHPRVRLASDRAVLSRATPAALERLARWAKVPVGRCRCRRCWTNLVERLARALTRLDGPRTT